MKADTAIHTAWEEWVGWDPANSERNLMRAVLRTAMEDIRKRGTPHREARDWLRSEEEIYLYSFQSVCSHLGLCARTVRALCGIYEKEDGSDDDVAA